MRIRETLKKVVQAKVALSIFNILPNFISIFAGKLGFSRYIKHDKNVIFRGKAYNGKYIFSVHGDRYIEREAASNYIGINDPIRAISRIKLENAVVIDAGANVGTISLFIADRGASKIYSFEPGPLFKDLKNNIAINNLEETIIPIQLGISDNENTMFWAEDQNNRGNALLLEHFNELDMSKIQTNFGNASLLRKVSITTLDKYFVDENVLNRLDLIKIDVECLELKVIRGAKGLIKKFQPAVIAETHRGASDMMHYDCMTPLFDFFYSLNYKSYSLKDDGELEKFIYPNFKMDTLFLPNKYILNSIT